MPWSATLSTVVHGPISLIKILTLDRKFTKSGSVENCQRCLPCVLFDAVNNLRAVLDQTGYSSAIASKRPSFKAVKFPFGPCEQDFLNNLAGGCKDLPPEIRALFKEFKAYKGEN